MGGHDRAEHALGAPPGLARILFLDTHGKAITQRPQRVIQIYGIPESSTAERPDRPYQSVEDKADDEGDPQIASEGDFLTEINKQEVRRQRLHNIARARRLSRNDALLETMQGLVSDTLSSVGRIDEVTKKHHEAQLEITDKLLDLARKAQPPPPPPDWPSMFEKITGHLSTVVLGAMKAREALPAPKITPALPAPEKDSALDDVKEALLKATAEIAETRKRTDRIEEMFLQLLAAKQQPEPKQPEPKPPEPKQQPEPKPPEPKQPEPKPPEPKQPDAKPDAKDSDEPPPPPPPVAANESTTTAPTEAAPIARNPHRVAWNKIKRMIVSLTDGDILAFLVQPQLAVMYLGILASMVPPC